MSRPKAPPAPAPAPAPVSQTVEPQEAPDLVTANEQDLNVKKKKTKKHGTSSLNTDSGLNVATYTSP